jgi:DNA-binding XRE family transcriptional regulator
LKKMRTNLQKLREEHLLSKAELARRAGVSALTIDRIEAGMTCRLDTKRKIILGLGLSVTERERVFGDKERRRQNAKR